MLIPGLTHPQYAHLVCIAMYVRENIQGTKINIKVNPEYPWTIIIIGGETGRQMVQTMQITMVACAPPCSAAHVVHTFTYSCARARTERLFQVLRQRSNYG